MIIPNFKLTTCIIYFMSCCFCILISSCNSLLTTAPLRLNQPLRCKPSIQQVRNHQIRSSLTSIQELHSLPKEQVDAIQSFSSHINQALHNSIPNNNVQEDHHQFISFTLKGPKEPRKTKSMNEDQIKKVQEMKEKLRGRMKLVTGRIISLRDKTKKTKKKKNKNENSFYLQLTVKFFGATDIAKNWCLNHNDFDYTNDLKQLIIGEGSGEGDSFTISEWGKVQPSSSTSLSSSSSVVAQFQSAELELSHGKWVLDMKQQQKKVKCKFLPAKKKTKNIVDNGDADGNTQGKKKMITISSHDKTKNVLLSPSAQFFQRLGITDANGKPKIAKSAKLRQCQKFVEIVSNLVNDSLSNFDQGDEGGSTSSSSTAPKIITHDMGCGRGYLTFALHSHLYNRFKDRYNIQSRGVDVRPKLVKEINTIADDLGQEFEGLQFVTGTIEDTTNLDDEIDILIALHACDTATDDSIWYGIQRKAKIIVTAPCCHKEVRRHINAHINNDKSGNHPYADILRHNIYKERIAETITDSMRALLLEIADYDVQVFEFIGGEHTSKNVMITAVKRKKPRSISVKSKLRQRLRSLTELHGIRQQKLALMMGESLHEETSISTLGMKKMGMPPI